jgi:hydrogenase maturation protease
VRKPVLVFGYGNISRGDDAVGPLLLDYLEQHADLSRTELLTDFQLQIEHTLDLEDRQLVIFVDASVAGEESYAFSKLKPCKDNSYSSHAVSPAALLQVFENVTGQTPPPSFLLSIQAESFELGDDLSAATRENLRLAEQFAENLLERPVSEILASFG